MCAASVSLFESDPVSYLDPSTPKIQQETKVEEDAKWNVQTFPPIIFASEEGAFHFLKCEPLDCSEHSVHPLKKAYLFVYSGTSPPAFS